MGLTIHYSLSAGPIDAGRAKEIVRDLRDVALALSFDHVSEIVEAPRGSGRTVSDELDAFGQYLTDRAAHPVFFTSADQDEETILVDPAELIAFAALPGRGCEVVPLGLATYPSRTTRRGQAVPTGLDGWRWWGFCKTQYASDPSVGGVKSFLERHLRVVSLLDATAKMGVLGEVLDESGYWEKRDIHLLAAEVTRWNAVMAAAVGALQDGLERTGVDRSRIVSEITSYPSFEHLEAKGRLGGAAGPPP